MWSTALARVYPTQYPRFLPSLPSPEAKVLENLWFMGEGKGEGKRQISGGGARILVDVVKAVKAKNVGIV